MQRLVTCVGPHLVLSCRRLFTISKSSLFKLRNGSLRTRFSTLCLCNRLERRLFRSALFFPEARGVLLLHPLNPGAESIMFLSTAGALIAASFEYNSRKEKKKKTAVAVSRRPVSHSIGRRFDCSRKFRSTRSKQLLTTDCLWRFSRARH